MIKDRNRGNFDVVPIQGRYAIQKDGRRRARHHDSFSAAEAAAARLVEANPDDTFIITQEVARVERPRPRRNHG